MENIKYILDGKEVVVVGMSHEIKPVLDQRFKDGLGFDIYFKEDNEYFYQGCHWKSPTDDNGTMSGRYCSIPLKVKDLDLIKLFNEHSPR